MGDINLGITFSSIYNVSQGNKKKFLEGNSNFFDKKLRILWEIILLYVRKRQTTRLAGSAHL